MTTPNELRAMVNKAMGSDVLHMASDEKYRVTYIPTDVLPIDVLMRGGIPRGRFTTIVGDFSTLKSYIGLKTIANVQRNGGIAALIDTEHSFDPEWAENLGVNLDDLLIERPETGELAIDTAEGMVRAGVDLIVFDSVAGALPQAERIKRLHGENVQMARIAALMSVAMRKLTTANEKTAIIWINQLRMNVGVTFGNPEVATGGKALPYYSSYIINIRKTGRIVRNIKAWDGEKWIDTKEVHGQKFRAFVEKSKLSAPHREIHFVWDLDTGTIDEVGFLIAQGLEKGFVTQSGSTWRHGPYKAVGRQKFRDLITNTPEAQWSLRKSVSSGAGIELPTDTGGTRTVRGKRSSPTVQPTKRRFRRSSPKG